MRIPKMFFLVAGGAALAACASSAKYKKALNDNAALTAKASELESKNGDLANKNSDLEKQLQSTQAEKDALLKQNQEAQAQYDQLNTQLSKEVKEGQLKVTQYQNMLTVDVAEQIFFDSGSATLKDSGKAVLKKLGNALGQIHDKVIRVVGHTDNVPIKSARFASNWELSVTRATNVVRFLQEATKIDPKILEASGRGEFSPLASNDTPEGRKKNRRIEIMLMDKAMAEAVSKPTK